MTVYGPGTWSNIEPDELVDVLDADGSVLETGAIVVDATNDELVYRMPDWPPWEQRVSANRNNGRRVRRLNRKYRGPQ